MLYQELEPSEAIDGEPVLVVTKMGNLVAKGLFAGLDERIGAFAVRVTSRPDLGGHSSEALSYYDTDLYSLATPGDDYIPSEFVAPERSNDPPVDVEVEVADEVSEGANRATRATDCTTLREANGEPDGGADGEAGGGEGAPSAPGSGEDVRLASPSDLDVDRLPPKIRKRLVGISELDEDQVDRILSDVSEAAMRSMKSVGVPSKELFRKVVEIQDAVRSVLESKNKGGGKTKGGKKTGRKGARG